MDLNPVRKSKDLGLSAPYDWSNSKIDDDVLILKVLEAHRFEDVLRVCAYYGLAKVKLIADGISNSYVSLILRRMLANIERGFENAGKQNHGGT